MILCIENLLVNFIDRTTIRIFDPMQHVHHSLVTLSIVELGETLDILKNEHLGLPCLNVLVQLEEQLSTAFFIVESLFLACSGEWLTRESCNINVAVLGNVVVPVMNVLIEGMWRMVHVNHLLTVRITLRTELVLILDAEIVQSVNWSFHTGEISAD